MTTRHHLTTPPWLRWAFTQLWAHRLQPRCGCCPTYRVVQVKGWRTALVAGPGGQRMTVTWL